MTIGFRKHPRPQHIPQPLLWRLTDGSRTVQAAVRQVPLGTELIVTVDGELLWSEVKKDSREVGNLADQARRLGGSRLCRSG